MDDFVLDISDAIAQAQAKVKASAAKRSGAVCPYLCSDLGRRCAWLAGYRDNHKGDL